MTLQCRLCLTGHEKDKLYNVFTCNLKNSKESFVDILFWVFSVEIEVTDQYGKEICHDCLVLVENVLEIRDLFQVNQKLLKEGYATDARKSVSKVGNFEKHIIPKRILSRHSDVSTSSRVQVSVLSLEEMCPLTLEIPRWEDSCEAIDYKALGNGCYKKRMYKHLKGPNKLLGDSYNDSVNKNIGELRTDEDVTNHVSITSENSKFGENPSLNSLIIPQTTEVCKAVNGELDISRTHGTKNDDVLLDIINITKEVSSALSETYEDYNWTENMFKRDIGTNTVPTKTKPNDFRIKVKMVNRGTMTKRFRRTFPRNTVRLKNKELNILSPRVWLEPVEYIIARENYEEVHDFCYAKKSVKSAQKKSEIEESVINKDSEIQEKSECNLNRNDIIEMKRQRFLDYYNNFSSFAVRELIAGKKIRDNNTNPVLNVLNVHNVFVCNYCSQSFTSKVALNMHYRRKHKSMDNSGTSFKWKVQKNGSLEDENNMSSEEDSVTSRLSNEVKEIKGRKTRKSLVRNISKSLMNSMRDESEHCTIEQTRERKRVNRFKIRARNKNNVQKNLAQKTMRTKNTYKQQSYIWDKKKLGTYSAITLYKKNNLANKDLLFSKKNGESRKDTCLGETIQKLTNRLELKKCFGRNGSNMLC